MAREMIQSKNSRPTPVATISVLLATAIMTGLQFRFPQLLIALRRTPGEISTHQYWRLITALFVHNGGWRQISFNFVAIAIVGVIVEKIYGSRLWLTLYFVCGVIGQIAGLYWKPVGAGASVAGAGLLGALAVWLIKSPLIRARFGGWLIVAGACVLVYFHDLHGPPILAGSVIALMFWLEPQTPVTHYAK
jgi:rhomboid protease GluP